MEEKFTLHTIEEAIEAIRDGHFIIVVDDEDRENEGDLIIAAECITPEKINFMETHARGLICAPVTKERAEELELPMMADVALKERRRLVLVLRETPLSAIHLEHMLNLTRLGAVMLPAAPGFYHQPRSIDDLVDFIVARILNQLGIEHRLMPRWGE
mgnify:CR=1 FL=1